MSYQIRTMKEKEYSVLEDFLYEAIFIPEGELPPPRTITRCPELQVYYQEFGVHKDDLCLVAEIDGTLVGAIWSRIMNDYGHVDEQTPSIALAVYKAYRNQGIGTALLVGLLEKLEERNYKRVSLAVQKANYAVKLYKSHGFTIVNETEDEYIMIKELSNE